MPFPTRPTRRLAALAGLALCGGALAAEGMWTLDNLPLDALRARYGFAPDAGWVRRAMQASLRLSNGCSGSFVSADGLVLTNHHCVAQCLEQLSAAGRDRLAEGFLARGRDAEPRCPEIELLRLDRITDVTPTLRQATAGLEGPAYRAAQDAARARLTTECRGGEVDTVQCELVTLYQGGAYQLYRYRRFSDVRLVWAPEEAIAAFGGDPDNFNFPRYGLDASLLRAYEHGRPAARDFLRVRPEGPQPGEPLFVTGHPGQTERLYTVAQLEAERERIGELALPLLSEQRGLLLQYARRRGARARLGHAAGGGREHAEAAARPAAGAVRPGAARGQARRRAGAA